MIDLERLQNESKARHYGIEPALAAYLSNWSDWLVCRPMSRLPGAPSSGGIFALGVCVEMRDTSTYLVLPFYFGDGHNLASVTVPQVDVEPLYRAYAVIEDEEQRRILVAALRQASDRERDSIGSFLPITRCLVSRAGGRVQLPDSFPRML